MAKKKRGFAAMPKRKHRELAIKGGHARWAKRVGHLWTREEAIAKGRKGGETIRRRAEAKRAIEARLDAEEAAMTEALGGLAPLRDF